jgi:hypothetical protein
MTTRPGEEMIELLACDIAARPAGAPGIDAIAGRAISFARGDGDLAITFAAEAADDVAAFAAAERACCASLGWHFEREPAVLLRITATSAQLDAIERMFAPA